MSDNENMDENMDNDNDLNIITMTGENGEQIDFYIVDSVKDEEDVYLLLVECENIEDDEADAYIFKQVSEDGDDLVFEELKEDEYEKVVMMFEENEGNFDINLE